MIIRKNKEKIFGKFYFFAVALTFIQTIFVPGLASARYFAHLFIVPTCATGILLYKKNRKELCLFGMYGAYFINIRNLVNFSYYNFERINISRENRDRNTDHLK